MADTYAALGALSELVYRLPQTLDQTVRGITSDPSVKSTSGTVDADLPCHVVTGSVEHRMGAGLAAISDQIAKATTASGGRQQALSLRPTTTLARLHH